MKKIRNIDALLDAWKGLNVLIIGDVMVDAYMWGRVERISPEAPVPVVAVDKKESRLGGAANVALNVQAAGANPLLCSVIGSDANSRIFIELMHQRGLDTEGIYLSPSRSTIVKTRVIGNNHQLLRIDEENADGISVAEQKHLYDRIAGFIKNKKTDVIIFEDYDKGVINKSLIEKVVKLARRSGIPVAVDPKKKNFNHYKGVTLLKPNLKELREGMKADLEKGNTEEIGIAAAKLAAANHLDMLLITLSERGAYLYSNNEGHHIPAHIRNISDVSGAGDTVISIAALCLALGVPPVTLAALANLAGGIVCEKVGVVPIDIKRLAEEARNLKIF